MNESIFNSGITKIERDVVKRMSPYVIRYGIVSNTVEVLFGPLYDGIRGYIDNSIEDMQLQWDY